MNIDLNVILAAMATPDNTDDIALLRDALASNDVIALSDRDDAGFAGSGDDSMFGRGGDDVLYGDNGDDILNGGAGADALVGGKGLDAAGYQDASSGIVASLDGSVANTGDAAGDIYVSIENLVGSQYADTLIGNIRANVIDGGLGSDTLFGKGGADALKGGSGNDVFYGGRGADRIDLGTGVDRVAFDSIAEAGDRVTNFSFDDQFLFKASAFGNLDLGVIDDTVFTSGATNSAKNADDHFIFRTTDNTLWYDSDGTGAAAAVLMATLTSKYVLLSEQIIIV